MEVDPAVAAAIEEGVKAGVHWTAARLNPKTAATWEGFAELHHERAEGLLERAIMRLGAGGAAP